MRLVVSFEFFPPADQPAEVKLWETIARLAPLGPRFVSVTYGAGGSTRDRTDRMVRQMRARAGLTPAAHVTCVGAARGEIDSLAHGWWAAGVRHLVALRGDAPDGAGRYVPHPNGYANAAALVAGLRRIGDFDISVAAYPETHPDSPSSAACLDNLKRKIDAGAARAITQFFFAPETFLRFRDAAAAAGIRVPIIPGILPVTNFAKVIEFARRCGTSIPPALADLFDGLDDDPETRALVAATAASELCLALAVEGVDAFHFYTLNRPLLTLAICRRLGLRPKLREAA